MLRNGMVTPCLIINWASWRKYLLKLNLILLANVNDDGLFGFGTPGVGEPVFVINHTPYKKKDRHPPFLHSKLLQDTTATAWPR